MSTLLSSAARVCSVEFLANAANGWAAVIDTPDGTETNAQAQVKSEPGAATSFNSESRYFGEEGRSFFLGLAVRVVNGTLIVQWSGSGP